VITVNGFIDMANLGRLVKQSNEFARNKLSIRNLMAVRVLACLFSIVREDDIDFQELTVPARAVLRHTGGENYKVLKMICDRLSDCVLERRADDCGEIQKYALFSGIRYEDGTIFAKFHPAMEPFFLGLSTNFMKYDLQEFLRLPSIYSQKLFEYLKSWDDCAERIEDLETLYALLGIPEYIRANFKDFRRRILDKAYQDILGLTSLRYEWEAIQKGSGKTSPVTAIRFIFPSEGQNESSRARKEARDKKIRDERNRLFLESMKCFESRPNCETPGKTPRCAVCFKGRGLELPEFLRSRLPEYE
jgi:plasmid replication initiation protein